MGKDTMNLISISVATPAQVEAFRYQDGGLEKNVQDEFDARFDHIQVARVVNWEIANEADYGLTGWTPSDSLLLYISSDNLFITEGLAYMGGRFLESGSEIFSSNDPATDTYYVYLKYTFASDTYEYEYATSVPTDTDLAKYLMLGTVNWNTTTKVWATVVDLRASNTSLYAPATISGSDAGAIFTVENTGAGDGLLVKNSDAVIGESGTPQQLVIQGDGTKALAIHNSANSVELVCSAADTLKVQTVADGDAELIVKTLNGMVIGSGIVTTGEWQGTIVAKVYLAQHDHTAIGEGGDYAWADITGFGAGSATTVSRTDHAHTTYYTKTEQGDWDNRVHAIDMWESGSITEETYLNYPVFKIPANNSDWVYAKFRIPENWGSTTNSVVRFLMVCTDYFTDSDEWYVDVAAYGLGDIPSATWNIHLCGSTALGVALGLPSMFEMYSPSDLEFEAGDMVIARFKWDGIENDKITYVYHAHIAYN